MSTFDQSQWADSAFARAYLESADHYIPDRHYLFQVLRSYCRAFVRPSTGARICDLGCGDGVLTAQLFEENANLEATLIDGSAEMLDAARRRLAGRSGVKFVHLGFDDLIRNSSALGTFDLVVSSFALHHLDREERRAIFGMIWRHLDAGGQFLNIDVALPSAPAHAEWYHQLWCEWILRHGERAGIGDKYAGVPQQARDNPDNKYSPLEDQLADLRNAGFAEVECHYRNGCFAIYSGSRPQAPGRR